MVGFPTKERLAYEFHRRDQDRILEGNQRAASDAIALFDAAIKAGDLDAADRYLFTAGGSTNWNLPWIKSRQTALEDALRNTSRKKRKA